MKRTLIALATLIALTGSADAQHRNHRHHGHHGYRGGWVAPLVGGMVLGGMGYYGYQRYYQPQPDCWDEMVGYDRRGREVWQRFCQ